jgi:SAM-dependent MidA family methyltransferase
MGALRELIADRIRASGPISFAEFMELSLYHPELGYYARAAQQTGRAGDFFTSVDVGPLFGELLAKQFAEMWEFLSTGSDPRTSTANAFDLVEAGAGNGRLARDILDAAERNDPAFYAAIGLSLVEKSAVARAAQADTLGRHARLVAHSSASLPANIHGVIFANELLDALPTHATVMAANGLREVYVDLEPRRHEDTKRPESGEPVRFVERLEEPSKPEIAEYLARAGAEMRQGWRAEVNLAAEAWIERAASALDRGFLVIIDYGHEQSELYSVTHAGGTLASFARHAQPEDFLQRPGEVDITAHVDLTAITRAAERSGLDVIGRLDQTYFLLGLAAADIDGMSLPQRLAMKTLMLPGGLGSTHKVLIFGKGVGRPALKGLSYRVRLT